ncbi:hypothetical protein M422DRAFT_58813 [Sphaerobolus stellatus SS14]|nr:hypothetical protein M422DRAFT_58813 [Sphaerobolus stellatus SS14]
MQSFLPEIVDPTRPDGYWAEAFPFKNGETHTPDVVGYGLGTSDATSKIELYLNPYRDSLQSTIITLGWDKIEIAKLEFPVAFSYADISGNGFNDGIISDRYGSSMNDIWPDGGRVSWFENTGDRKCNVHWKRRYIGQSPGMHRFKVGHFSTTSKLQIVAVPIIVKSKDLTTPAPVIIWTAPDDPCDAPVDDDSKGWPKEVPFPSTFRLVHEVVVVPAADPSGGLDRILLAGREGINLIWYDPDCSDWKYENLGVGLPPAPRNPYWGSGSVAVARVGNDSAGYIASAEAFHGNHVSVYTKTPDAPPNTLAGVQWTRRVLENFGPLNKEHTGSIHEVVCADIDGDGVDEMLVALMGSDPPSWEKTGVWCYKPVNLQNGTFARFKLSDNSAGRIALGNFTNRKFVDFSTISYSVPGYFESPNPSLNLYANSPITAEKLNDEVLFRIPQPSSTNLVDEVEFLDVASRKLALVMLPPNTSYSIASKSGIKIISGRIFWTDQDGNTQYRTQAIAPFTAESLVLEPKDGQLLTRDEGCAFMLLKPSSTSGQPPYSNMDQLVAHNIFSDRFPADVRNMTFPWIKVQDRPWANGRFKGLEFYNLVGFHVRSADDSDQVLCHIQLWTAGVGVSAGFHNHTGEVFCEIHACLVNGTGQGGMSWAKVPDDQFNPTNPDPQKYDSVVVNNLHEHGPLWRTSRDGIPEWRTNGTVDYPWHAWIAGPGDPSVNQSFDVWIAFEFPPILACPVEINAQTSTLSPGTYTVTSGMRGDYATVRNGDAIDGTPIIGTLGADGKVAPEQQWMLESVHGSSRFMTLRNVASTSFATSSWPPVDGQALVGARYIAVLGITSQWAATPIALRKFNSSEGRQLWKLTGIPQ